MPHVRRNGVAGQHGRGWGHARVMSVRQGNRKTVQPPPLREEQQRCPVCRNAVTLTSRGYLRRHRDLFGLDCYNKAVGAG
jgi:hypothetical protein